MTRYLCATAFLLLSIATGAVALKTYELTVRVEQLARDCSRDDSAAVLEASLTTLKADVAKLLRAAR